MAINKEKLEMKHKYLPWLSLLFLTACSESPSSKGLLGDSELMAAVQQAAQRRAQNAGVVPITFNIGALVDKNFIDQPTAEKIKAVTHCQNLSGIELTFAQRRVTRVDVNPSKCATEE